MTNQSTAALEQVAAQIFPWSQGDGTWWINNAGVVTGKHSSLVVDTCATEARTRALLSAEGETVASAAPDWAVNTHAHGDHTYGHSLLPTTTSLIGHDASGPLGCRPPPRLMHSTVGAGARLGARHPRSAAVRRCISNSAATSF